MSSYRELVKQWLLEYITVDETASWVGQFREKILFSETETVNRTISESGLPWLLLTDSIGYSSLTYNWAELRRELQEPIVDISRLWSRVYSHFNEDYFAKEENHLPRRLSRVQQAALQYAVNSYERALGNAAGEEKVTVAGIGMRVDAPIELARLGYGGSTYRDKESPFYSLMEASDNPHFFGTVSLGEFVYLLTVVPYVFHGPLEGWAAARGGDLLVAQTAKPRDLSRSLRMLQEAPVYEFFSMSMHSAASREKAHEMLEGSVKYVLNYLER